MERNFTKDDTALVKGVAILCMLFYHLFENEQLINLMDVNYSPLPLNVFLTLSGFGNICVAVFAFLSAYGISKTLLKAQNEDLKFWYLLVWKRYLKLLIGFVSVFATVNLIWFTKFNYVGLYGNGWQGGLCALLDALGLAQIAGTPTLCETWWYMEIAIIIIFITPLILKLTKKMGNYIIIVGALLPTFVELPYDFKRYYFVILFGVVAANEDWFEKILAKKINKVWQYVLGLILLALLVVFRQNYLIYNQFGFLVDAPIAFLISLGAKELLGVIPGINKALGFLGRHSMNIYFVHSFIYLILYQKFIYSFKYAGLIFVVLLLVCLIYSIILEGVKAGIVKILEKWKCRQS